ncbi:MAG: hypothetical protein B6243_04390 [Anaerolineaceae bacterium 4572_5.2]|nr:MAG: hypothetical protein B6243_04390 [Anaerolineaceae bacterium 4572_5.2]
MTATMLSREAFETSRRFVETMARPLEVGRFYYHFEGASDKSVRNRSFPTPLNPPVHGGKFKALPPHEGGRE